MICSHVSIKEATTGQQDDCLICRLPIIFDGLKWQVTWAIGPHKVRKLRTVRTVNRIKEGKI